MSSYLSYLIASYLRLPCTVIFMFQSLLDCTKKNIRDYLLYYILLNNCNMLDKTTVVSFLLCVFTREGDDTIQYYDSQCLSF